MSAMLASAATDAPTPITRRCPVPLIGALPSPIMKCTAAAGTAALAAISRRLEPRRLRRSRFIPAVVGRAAALTFGALVQTRVRDPVAL
jgi:hypothetical protein